MASLARTRHHHGIHLLVASLLLSACEPDLGAADASARACDASAADALHLDGDACVSATLRETDVWFCDIPGSVPGYILRASSEIGRRWEIRVEPVEGVDGYLTYEVFDRTLCERCIRHYSNVGGNGEGFAAGYSGWDTAVTMVIRRSPHSAEPLVASVCPSD